MPKPGELKSSLRGLIPRPGFVFALILAGLLLMQHVKGAYTKSAEAESLAVELNPVDRELLFAFLPLIGLGLGIELDRHKLIKGAREILLTLAKSNEAPPESTSAPADSSSKDESESI